MLTLPLVFIDHLKFVSSIWQFKFFSFIVLIFLLYLTGFGTNCSDFYMLILFLLHSLSVLLILVYLCCRTYFQVCYKENHLGMKMLPSKLLQLWAAANMLLQCFSCTGLFVQNAMFAGAFQIPKFGANCCFIAMVKARSFSFPSSSINYDARVYTFYL